MSDSKTIRLLIVEDDEDDFFLLKSNLKDSTFSKEIAWAHSYEKALEMLETGTYDLAVIDYRLGIHTGLELMAHIRRQFPFLPTILLTGLKASSIDEEALRSGVSDYLAKDDYSPESIDRSIRYAIERARVLRSLKESENKFKNLFENATEYVFLAGKDRRIVDLNKAAMQLFRGMEKDQVIGTELSSFISPMPGAGAENKEVQLLLPGQDKKRTCILTMAMADSQQQIFQWVLHDITERIQNEEREKVLEKQALTGKFARIIAHEIKNPLTNINLSLLELRHLVNDLQAQKKADSDPEEFISIIERNSKRINTLIEDLLNATRFDTLDRQPLPLDELVNAAVANISDRIRLKAIRLEKNIQPGIRLKADKEKMTIALLNLLVNAVEAMDEKTGVLEISASPEERWIRLLVRDNGKGIPENDLPRLFEPFFTSKKGGTGLGLTATYNIITKHDGNIEVQSEPGKGTTFIITLPALSD